MDSNNILLSFIGSNDSGKLGSEGAIYNTVKHLKFHEIHLLWIENNKPNEDKNKFLHIGNLLKKKLLKKYQRCNILIEFLDIKNPVDHNEIYPKLLEYCNNLKKSKANKYTAAISSGTPSMQVCWILMAESKDFKMDLIRTNEPSFGEVITKVKLKTSLPRINSLTTENKEQKRTIQRLLPILKISTASHKILIGDTVIPLSPMQFCYYFYFVEKAKDSLKFEKIPGIYIPNNMSRKILEYHKKFFTNNSDLRRTMKEYLRNGDEILKTRLSENMSQIKKIIKNKLNNDYLAENYFIQNTGIRNDGEYKIELNSDKIEIDNKY